MRKGFEQEAREAVLNTLERLSREHKDAYFSSIVIAGHTPKDRGYGRIVYFEVERLLAPFISKGSIEKIEICFNPLHLDLRRVSYRFK